MGMVCGCTNKATSNITDFKTVRYSQHEGGA